MASTTPTRSLLAGVLASGVLGCSSSDAVVPQDAIDDARRCVGITSVRPRAQAGGERV